MFFFVSPLTKTRLRKLGVILGEAPEVKVLAGRDGTLRLSSKPEVKWVEVEPLLFRDPETGTYLNFRENDRQQISYMFLGSSVLLAFEKLAWYEAVRFQAAVMVICLITFLEPSQKVWGDSPQVRKQTSKLGRRVRPDFLSLRCGW